MTNGSHRHIVSKDSAPALHWVEAIFKERLGPDFALRREGADTVLRLPGAESRVLFPSWQSFDSPSAELPFCWWNGGGEALVLPLGARIPAPGAGEMSCPLVSFSADDVRFGFDLPGLVFWALSRKEELEATDTDEHGRFSHASSHAYRHQYLDRPVVDEWFHLLRQVVERIWPGSLRAKPTFRMLTSHDIDAPSRIAFQPWHAIAASMVREAAVRRRPGASLNILRVKSRSSRGLLPEDPANTFGLIMDMAERHGSPAAFYFICGRTDRARDARYEPGAPAIRRLMRDLHARGGEIGLHPSYGTFLRPDLIAAEAARLRGILDAEGIRQPVVGGRMHYLRMRVPSTLRSLQSAGLAHDATLGYAHVPGFRCGTCFEYPAFDLEAGEAMAIRVRPLVAMEATIIAPKHMDLGYGGAALEKFMRLKNACRSVGGEFTLLWHNSELEKKEAKDLYAAVLEG
jgi:hypothetical protein